MGKVKRKPRPRATEERWLFKVMTNNGLAQADRSTRTLARRCVCFRCTLPIFR